MVAYYFPPAGGAGVQRTLKFTRYLPGFGWRPHLVVPRDADYPVLDPTLAGEIPAEATVHRTRIIEPYEAYRRLTGRGGQGSLDVATLSRDAAESRRPGERIAEWVRSTFFVPDARIGWYPFASRTATRLARELGPSVLYSSAPPYTTHLVARAAHRATGIPWVCDFRDSWVDWLSAARRSGLPRRIELGMERSVLTEATRVVTVSGGVADDLASRHAGVRDARWHVIPNGYDPEDFAAVEPDRDGVSPDELLVAHAGTLYGPRDPETLIAALESLASDGHPAASRIRVRLVGRIAGSFEKRIAGSPVRERFTLVPYVDHRRVTALSAAADVLFLVVDDVPQAAGILTGKLFEYLGLRKPILALGPEGEAMALVRGTGAGMTVRPGDVQAMRDALETLWTAFAAGTLEGPSRDAVRAYERRTLTGRLAALFDDVAR
jgi:glycosyltransferase involved in cell wall biosynthesis